MHRLIEDAQKIVGRTLLEGGVTWGANGEYGCKIYENGYAVGGVADCRVIGVERFSMGSVIEFVLNREWTVGDFLGTWIEENMVYLDVSNIFSHETRAHEVARERGEKEYYDFENGVGVRV